MNLEAETGFCKFIADVLTPLVKLMLLLIENNIMQKEIT